MRTLHLTQRQAEQVAAQLLEIVDALEDAGPGEPRFRAVVAVYGTPARD